MLMTTLSWSTGLLAIHIATDDSSWLQTAQELTDQQIELFWDEADGGFFFTSSDHEQLLVRGKLLNEGARPSGSAVTAENLVYLSRALDDPRYAELAKQTIQSAAHVLTSYPAEAPRMVNAVEQLLSE